MTTDFDIAEAKFPNLREGTIKIREHVNFILFLARNNPSLTIKVFLPKRHSGIVLQKLHDLRQGFPTISMAFYEEGSTMGQHFCQPCDYYMIWFDVLSIMVMACGLYCQFSCRHVLKSMVWWHTRLFGNCIWISLSLLLPCTKLDVMMIIFECYDNDIWILLFFSVAVHFYVTIIIILFLCALFTEQFPAYGVHLYNERKWDCVENWNLDVLSMFIYEL